MSYANDPLDQVLEGMQVVGSDGNRLGVVAELTIGLEVVEGEGQLAAEERGYFRLRREGDAPPLYVPGDAIQDVAPDRVTLRYANGDDALESLRERPASGAESDLLRGL